MVRKTIQVLKRNGLQFLGKLTASRSKFATSLSSGPWIAATVLFSLVFLCAYWFRNADNDLFARVAVGRLIALNHSVPLTDPFAYSATKPVWIDHEWLAGLIFYIASQNGGDITLFALNMILAFFTLYFLVAAQRMLAHSSKAGFILLFLAMFPSTFIWNSTVRCQAFTFFFFSVILFLVAKFRSSGPSSLFIITPLIFLVWANLHAGFVVGLGFLALASLGMWLSHMRRAVLLMGVCALSTGMVLINPYGFSYIYFILDAVTKARPAITEWASASLSGENIVFFGFCGLAILALGSRSRKNTPLEGWLFIFVSMFFALKHQRHIPFFLWSLCVYLPSSLEDLSSTFPTWIKGRIKSLYEVTGFFSAIALIIGTLALSRLILTTSKFELDYSRYPVEALEWLHANSNGGKLMLHFNDGSYALLAGYPKFKIAIDGRYEEVYPDSTFDQALSALHPNDPQFLDSFNALHPDFVILCRSSIPLEVANYFPGKWEQVYLERAGNCAVFSENPIRLKDSLQKPIAFESIWNLRF